MNDTLQKTLTKVPAITLGFWVMKIVATTLGETGGDAASMTMNLGYLIASVIFLVIFLMAVAVQISVRHYHPALYWFVIVATTTVGTTMADFADRSLGVGYPGGAAILLFLLLLSLSAWWWALGSVSVETVVTPKAEMFYWATIMFSQTLGTALGDWMADTNGLGYEGGALVFSAGLVIIALAYYFTQVSRTLLFWSAFVLTRPLGATLGDLLDKPIDHGGLAVSRITASLVLVGLLVVGLLFLPQRAARQAH